MVQTKTIHTVKLKTFKVTGTGNFPIDMLRYDACWPATESDAAHLQFEKGRRTITLHTHNPSAPTNGRWNSFLWNVAPS